MIIFEKPITYLYLSSVYLGLGIFLALSGPVTAAPLNISVSKSTGSPGGEVTVEVACKGVKNAKGASGLSLRLTFDPELLTFKSVEKGPTMPNALVEKSVDEKLDPGHLGLGFICGSKTPGSKEFGSVEEDGVLLKVVFVVNAKATIGQKCPLKIDNANAIDSAEPPVDLQVVTEDGEFTVEQGLPWFWIAIAAGVLVLLLLLLGRRRKEEAPAQQAANRPAYTPSGGKAAFCSACGKQLTPGAAFCSGCGNRVG